MVRFQVSVDEQTFKALRSLSQQEYRDWRMQAGFLIREALSNRGYVFEPSQSGVDKLKKVSEGTNEHHK